MKAEQITDNEIREFLEWFFTHYECDTERVALLAISAAGYFHLTQKTATPLIHRAIVSGFLANVGKDTVKRVPGTPEK